jgi:anti-anti-sigma factor
MRGIVTNGDPRTPGGIEVRAEREGSLVRLWGEIDASLRDEAGVAMVELVELGGPFTVDVAEVTFIDSSGLAFIVQLHRLATDDGTSVVLRDPPALVLEMLDMIDVAGSMPLKFSGTDAISSSAAQSLPVSTADSS